ncbi:MAG: hypothetical protein WCJ64_04110 [Rhodospirillaceae bacterium]
MTVFRLGETKREQHLSDEEMIRVGTALADASSSVLPGIIAAIRLLSATGSRLGEVLALRWEDVDLEVGAPRERAVDLIADAG